MPRQNRVTPFSTLTTTPARGTLTGNRGCLHDEHGQIRRDYQGQRWIICLLEFKGRRRAIMQPGHYTELFFLDEATALAAGHRPCAECQRERFNLFREMWVKGNPHLTASQRPAAKFIDAVLHAERTSVSDDQRRYSMMLDDLPDGTFVTDDERQAYVVLNRQVQRWTPAGYERAPTPLIHYPVHVLTPASIVRTLTAGYPVHIHPSAQQALPQTEEASGQK